MKKQLNNEQKSLSNYESKTYGWATQEQLLLLPNYLNLIGELSGKEVLDLGCGNGWLTKLLAQRAKSVFGCDISPEMIDIANKENLLSNIDYQVLNATDIGSLNKRFDMIVCSLMLHASQSKESMIHTLEQASKLLKENGCMVILVPHPCFSTKNKRSYNTYTFDPSFNYFKKDQIYNVKLVSSNGATTEFSNIFYNLQDYFDAFNKAGFVVGELVEPQIPSEYCNQILWESEIDFPSYIMFKLMKGGLTK